MPGSPSTPATQSEPVTPAVIDQLSTLGHVVYLGELYDQRSAKFLSAQLYSHGKHTMVSTPIEHTDLTLSLSTTREEKTSILDVHAEISLKILWGAIKISGSGSYIKDVKSNTNEYSFALALKMRLREERSLFAEAVPEDHSPSSQATHFVSSIVYGGNVVINLVSRESRFSKGESLKGFLKGALKSLVGGIKLGAEADPALRDKYRHLDDKFDLIVHSDVALDNIRAPVNPHDVLDFIPNISSLIRTKGGVPISVTLQPIPRKSNKPGFIYRLDVDFVDAVLKAFSMLDDISSRFQVLQDKATSLGDFIPELVRKIRDVAAEYTKDHTELLLQLREFSQGYEQDGNKAQGRGVFAGTSFEGIGDRVLEKAMEVYRYHLDPSKKNGKVPVQYPSSLSGLEHEFSRFRDLAFDIQTVRGSLISGTSSESENVAPSLICLSGIEDVSRAIGIRGKITLFVMIPVTDDRSNPNLTAVRYLAMLRKYAVYVTNPTNPAHMLYAENLDTLESQLPSNKVFSRLTKPSCFTGEIDNEGDLNWNPLPPPPP